MSTERGIVQRLVLEPLLAASKRHYDTLTVGYPERSYLSSPFTIRNTDNVIATLKEPEEPGASDASVFGDNENAGLTSLKPSHHC